MKATSALDNTTEQAVMEAIEKLSHDLTILLIAHRLTTVRRCDIIVELEHGRVVAQGATNNCSNPVRALQHGAGSSLKMLYRKYMGSSYFLTIGSLYEYFSDRWLRLQRQCART